jgi:hypothetical protein
MGSMPCGAQISKRAEQEARIPVRPELVYNAPTAMQQVRTEKMAARTGLRLFLVILASCLVAGCNAALRLPAPALGRAPTPDAVDSIPIAVPDAETAHGITRTLFSTTVSTLAPPSDTPTLAPTDIPTPTRTPSATPQPLVPPSRVTRTATAVSQRATSASPGTEVATEPAIQAPKPPEAKPAPDRSRVCVDVPVGELADYDWGGAVPGLYVNFRVVPNPPDIGGTRFAQTVRIHGGAIFPSLDEIRATARRNPGSLWLVGNEPDVVLQDDATPEQYARSYGLVYRAIKEVDPAAQVAIAGVAQPTALRMAYLDRVLDAYREGYGTEMPVDVWNIHAYILREERDSWGAGIPPGMAVDQGQLYEIADHADMTIFRQQIADFRRWMAARGQRDKPLLISEYGILMPEDYGFPPETVSKFMVNTFDYFLAARDPQTGYPGDDNRLVQAFCWFSAAMPEFPTPDLFDPATKAITPVGKTFRAYVSALK